MPLVDPNNVLQHDRYATILHDFLHRLIFRSFTVYDIIQRMSHLYDVTVYDFKCNVTVVFTMSPLSWFYEVPMATMLPFMMSPYTMLTAPLELVLSSTSSIIIY